MPRHTHSTSKRWIPIFIATLAVILVNMAISFAASVSLPKGLFPGDLQGIPKPHLTSAKGLFPGDLQGIPKPK